VWTENIWCVFRVNPPFSNPSSVVWTEHYTVARLKQWKVEQYARLSQDYKNSRSSSEWSPFEPRAFLHTVTKGFRFWEWFRSWMCPHKMGMRFLRRSFSLCGIFLFLKYIGNTASIAMIYDNWQNFQSMLASSRALAVIFYFVLLTKSSVRLFKWNIFSAQQFWECSLDESWLPGHSHNKFYILWSCEKKKKEYKSLNKHILKRIIALK